MKDAIIKLGEYYIIGGKLYEAYLAQVGYKSPCSVCDLNDEICHTNYKSGDNICQMIYVLSTYPNSRFKRVIPKSLFESMVLNRKIERLYEDSSYKRDK